MKKAIKMRKFAVNLSLADKSEGPETIKRELEVALAKKVQFF